MTLVEFKEILKRDEALVREGLQAVLDAKPDHSPSVGKHEAQNWVHLKEVIALADQECPPAADTIRWLLWHEVLDAQRLSSLAEDIVQ